MKFNPEPDVWAPKDGAGYLQLFCFGLFIATIAVGGNIVLHYLVSSLQYVSVAF
ncbi:hypothetical protein [Synechococcus sp. M16CYN]|uniref:hypothetical protein n=1 Tax=Synechococcus sp. M16CYN TaxID=3103139 RepID=UPI00333E9B8F